jgi:hypothetical protein
MNKLTLPIYFKLPNGIRGEVGDWLKENDLLKSITYDWVTGMLAFELPADATALSIKFGIYPTRTTLDLMLEHEESNN